MVFCGRVQIELLVAAPAFADPCRRSVGIPLNIRCCLRGLLLQIPRALLLSNQQHVASFHYSAHADASSESLSLFHAIYQFRGKRVKHAGIGRQDELGVEVPVNSPAGRGCDNLPTVGRCPQEE